MSEKIMRHSTRWPSIEYPVSLRDNLIFRKNFLKRTETDPNFAKEMFKLCKHDIIFWIDITAWTKDPRDKEMPIRPFICYEFQIPEILKIQRYIEEGIGDLGIDKSRDMGASWLTLYVFQHQFQFSQGADFRVGSRKEDFVDKLGVIDTLMEKVRFNLSRQPMFLMPNGFETDKGFDENTPYMRLTNKAQQNSIIGESANNHFGSGGRSKAILLDEFSKWERGVDDQAWTSTADVTKCRIAISTPNGSGNKFARLMRGHEEKIEKSHLHWSLHPEKSKDAYYLDSGVKIPINLKEDYRAAFKLWERGIRVRSPWYDAEAERRTEADLAQEVDINYHKSGGMFFNSQALALQTPWQHMVRNSPDGGIPYGKFIRGKLVTIDDQVRFLETQDGWLKIFEFPRQHHQYTFGGDAAEGLTHGDESAGIIVDKSSGNVVASWNYKNPPEDFADDIALAVWYFNEADTACENNKDGYTVNLSLSQKSHVKLYYARNEKGEATDKRGFSTTSKTRPDMLNRMAHLVDKAAIELRDPILIGQCETFIRNGDKAGKPMADAGFLDDMVISCAIACYVTDQLPFVAKQPRVTAAQREAVLTRQRHKNGGFAFKS